MTAQPAQPDDGTRVEYVEIGGHLYGEMLPLPEKPEPVPPDVSAYEKLLWYADRAAERGQAVTEEPLQGQTERPGEETTP